jgi:hypothetical protein
MKFLNFCKDVVSAFGCDFRDRVIEFIQGRLIAEVVYDQAGERFAKQEIKSQLLTVVFQVLKVDHAVFFLLSSKLKIYSAQAKIPALNIQSLFAPSLSKQAVLKWITLCLQPF